jgi:LysR family transcriptional regulator, glycine cleavage system transcriptional activator
MRRSIPSLSALQAFEAAARLNSFSQAGEELHVTQSAISRQIRALEDELGKPLFTRLTRRVELTECGRIYAREISALLDNLERATSSFKAKRRHELLTINVLPSVANFWFMPLLGQFTKGNPDIETQIQTSIRPVNLQSGEADLAIRVGPLPGREYQASQPRIDLEMVTGWRGVHAEFLFPDVLVPVCSPALLEGRVISKPADVLDYPLIHTTSRPNAWPGWLSAHGLRLTGAEPSTEYGHFFMSIEAARNGEGIAIVPDVLLPGHDVPGLVIPRLPTVKSAGEYYLLTLEERLGEFHIQTFRNWLHQKVAATTPSAQ